MKINLNPTTEQMNEKRAALSDDYIKVQLWADELFDYAWADDNDWGHFERVVILYARKFYHNRFTRKGIVNGEHTTFNFGHRDGSMKYDGDCKKHYDKAFARLVRAGAFRSYQCEGVRVYEWNI